MIQPVSRGAALVREIESAEAETPVLWWLGQSGFAIKYRSAIFYIDPYLSNSQMRRYRRSGIRRERLTASPLRALEVRHADVVLATHRHGCHLDPGTLPIMLRASRRARLVLPKSAAGRANSFGIDYLRMTTTDVDLPVDIWKDGEHIRIEAIPSAHEKLEWSPLDGHPYLGYLMRFGDFSIYHSGDCVPYNGLAERLREEKVTVALLPVNGRDPSRGVPGNFTVAEAAQLAEEIGARWLAPMHYDMFAANTVEVDRFIAHMLGQRPGQRFKIFQCGEGWQIPAE